MNDQALPGFEPEPTEGEALLAAAIPFATTTAGRRYNGFAAYYQTEDPEEATAIRQTIFQNALEEILSAADIALPKDLAPQIKTAAIEFADWWRLSAE